MAGTVTTTISLTVGIWTQVVAASTQALITPTAPRFKILLRYAETQPGAGILLGHAFNNIASNAIVGSANTDIGWMKPLDSDVDVEVTEL